MLNANDNEQNNVYDFETPAAAGSAIILNNIDKTKTTPNLYLPDLGTGTHIRVRVTGDSMHSTIKDGDRAIATLLPNPKEDIRSGYCYVIIDREDGLVAKRLYKESGNRMAVVSDNELYPPYKRSLEDFVSIFKIIQVHTSDLRNYYDDVRKDVRDLQKSMQVVMQKLK
jgi:phage repressor protein C with HTH and peptisase S24 domain